jgi:flagellar biogenesis protein FliO
MQTPKADANPKQGAQLTIVGILVVIILILLVIYLFRRA